MPGKKSTGKSVKAIVVPGDASFVASILSIHPKCEDFVSCALDKRQGKGRGQKEGRGDISPRVSAAERSRVPITALFEHCPPARVAVGGHFPAVT